MNTSIFKGVMLCTLLVVISCAPVKDYETLMADAKASMQQREYREAIVLLKTALSDSPQSYEARYQLGKAYLAIGNGVSAEKELLRASELGLLDEDIASNIMEAILLQDNYNEAIVFANQVIPEITNSEWIRVYKLMALFYLNELEDVPLELGFIIGSQVDFIKGFARAVEMALDSNVDGAKREFEIINSLLDAPMESLLFNARFLSNYGKHQEAVDLYRKYLTQRVEDYKVYIFLTENLIELGKFKEADIEIKKVLRVNPEHPFANQLSAVINFHTGEFDLAREYSHKSLNNGNASSVNKIIQGIVNFRSGNYESAYQYLTQIIAYVPDHSPVYRVYQYTLYQLGYIDELADDFEQKNSIELIDYDLLAATSYELIKNNELETAKRTLSLIENSDFDPSARLKLNALNLAVNNANPEQYLEEMLVDAPANDQIRLALGIAYFKNNKIVRAFEFASQWLKEQPSSSLAYTLNGYLYLKANQVEQAEEVYAKALEMIPDHNVALLYQSYLLEKANDIEAAEKTVYRLIDTHPTYLPAYSRLHQINEKLDKPEVTETVLIRAWEQTERTEILALLAEHWVKLKRYQKVIDVLGKTSRNFIQKYDLMAQAYIALNQLSEAIAEYQKLLSQSNYAQLPLPMLAIYEERGEYEKALSVIEGVEKAIGNKTPDLLYLKALFSIYAKNTSTAVDSLSALKAMGVTGTYIDNLQGLLDFLQDDFAKALESLTSVYRHKPNLKTALSIYKINKKLKLDTENSQFLNQHIQRFPEDYEIKALLAQELLEEKPDESIKLYQDILKANKSNWPVMTNLAWLHGRKGNLEKAVALINEAREMSNSHPQTLGVYSKLMLDSENYTAIIKSVDEVGYSNLTSLDIKLRHIEALIRVGDQASASSLIKEIAELINLTPAQKVKVNLLQELI